MATVFFAFPYSFEDEYRRVLIAACHDLRAEYIFGDGSVSTGALVDKMSNSIEGSDHAFFDITGFNPNVMMELGMAYQNKRKIYFMYHSKKHKDSPSAKAFKELVPTNIRGQDHFEYASFVEFDAKIRSALKNALGIGQNSVHEMKMKINRVLASGPKRIRDIASTIGEQDQGHVSEVLSAMRTENTVTVKGHGMGAKWELLRR